MPTAKNGELQYESNRTFYAMSALTNAGDNTEFSNTNASVWSKKSGLKAKIRPDGLITGGAITPGTANDTVDVAACSVYLVGVKTAVSAAAAESTPRAATLTHITHSVTVNSSGVIAIVNGTEHTAVSEVRGAAGGPPYIPVGSIEIGQVRLTNGTPAVVLAAEINTVVGTHRERWDSPTWMEDPANGKITFDSALPLTHTADVPKAVYGEVAEPVFTAIALASDFLPPETTYSVNSVEVYRNRTVGSAAGTLGQGSFTAYLQNGITDALVTAKGEELWFKFFPDRLETDYVFCNGVLGISRTFPSSDNIQAACTISAESEATEVVA